MRICSPAAPHIIAFAALSAAALVCLGLLPAGLMVDDAYTTGRNAFLLAHGITTDPAYGTAPISGSTSTVHLLVLMLFSTLVTPEKALMLASIAGGWLYATAALQATRQLALGKNAPYGFFLFFVIGIIPLHLANGLETGLAMGTSLWILVLLMDRQRQSALLLAALGGIAVHVRIELAALIIPAFLLRAHDCRACRVKSIPVPVIMAAILAIAWFIPALFVYRSSGYWLPQTWAIKENFYADGCLPLSEKIRLTAQALLTLAVLYLPASAWPLQGIKTRLPQTVALFTAVFLAVYGLTFPSALQQDFIMGRYPSILIPGWVYCFLALAARHAAITRQLLISSCLLTSATCPLFVAATMTSPSFTLSGNATLPLAVWAEQNIPPGSMILLHDAGYFAVATDKFRLTDLVGLKSVRPARIHENLTAPSCGRDRPEAVAEIARTSGASWGLFMDSWYTLMGIRAGLAAAGYHPVERYRSGHIALYELQPPAHR